jgi:hypothetical protein
MAVALSEPISPNCTVDVRFDLPGIRETLELKGEFAWSDGKGGAGIRFICVPVDSRRWLGKWLSEQIEEPDTRRTPGKTSSRPPIAI